MEIKKEVHLSKAGTLEQNITKNEKMSVTHLKVSGNINIKDFRVLEDMCDSWWEYDEDENCIIDESEPPFLKVLDLGDCLIEDGYNMQSFAYKSKLKEIVLPKNLTILGGELEGAFEENPFLTKVILPNSLREIDNSAFMGCDKLQDINFPESLECIESFAFSGCSSLKAVKIPANVSGIGSNAFGHCYGLEKFDLDERNPYFSVIDGVLFNKEQTKLIAFPCGHKNRNYVVPDSVKIIESGSFAGSKIETIVFSPSLETMGAWSFEGCDRLKELVIPNSITEIGELAFRWCRNLKKVRLPNKLSILKEQTFSSCDSLREVEIPPSVKKIESTALGWAKNLERLIFHDGLEEFNDDLKFTKLKKLYIPKTVRKIASGLAIYADSKLNNFEFEVDQKNPYFCSIGGSVYSKDKPRLVKAFLNRNKKFVVPHGVQTIEQMVFAYLNLEEIELPDTLITLEDRCFDGCNLKKIRLPKSLTSMDFFTFWHCEKIKKIEVLATKPPKIRNLPHSAGRLITGDSKNAILYVPKESLEKYKKATGWKDVKRIEGI